MARTFGDAITRARFVMNDSSTTPRITTPELEGWANECVETMLDLRPDIFYGQHDQTFPPDTPYVSADALPFGNRWMPVVVDYLVFRGQMKDDEHVLAERAALSAQFFQKRLA